MPRHKSYEAWVECDGKRLEEYEVKTDGITISCWIASESGKTFRIQWKEHHDTLDINNELTFRTDGIEVDSHVLDGNDVYTMQGISIDDKTVKPLAFSAIAFVDNDMSVDCGRSRRDLGLISVDVQQVVITDKCSGWNVSEIPALPDNPWNEKEAKAFSHEIVAGPEIELQSEAFLRAQGIIAPAPPSSGPSQDKPEMSGSMAVLALKSSQAVPPPSTASKRCAPERLIKREEQELQVVDTVQSSERDLEENELLQRLEYLQKQQAEIQKQQDKITNSRNTKDPAALLRSLQFWQTRMREMQTQLAETLEMKISSRPSRKRVKCEHGSEGSTSIKQEDSKGIIDLSDD